MKNKKSNIINIIFSILNFILLVANAYFYSQNLRITKIQSLKNNQTNLSNIDISISSKQNDYAHDFKIVLSNNTNIDINQINLYVVFFKNVDDYEIDRLKLFQNNNLILLFNLGSILNKDFPITYGYGYEYYSCAAQNIGSLERNKTKEVLFNNILGYEPEKVKIIVECHFSSFDDYVFLFREYANLGNKYNIEKLFYLYDKQITLNKFTGIIYPFEYEKSVNIFYEDTFINYPRDQIDSYNRFITIIRNSTFTFYLFDKYNIETNFKRTEKMDVIDNLEREFNNKFNKVKIEKDLNKLDFSSPCLHLITNIKTMVGHTFWSIYKQIEKENTPFTFFNRLISLFTICIEPPDKMEFSNEIKSSIIEFVIEFNKGINIELLEANRIFLRSTDFHTKCLYENYSYPKSQKFVDVLSIINK